MSLEEFVATALVKVSEAAAQGRKDECVRLLRVISSECELQARRLEETQGKKEFRQWRP